MDFDKYVTPSNYLFIYLFTHAIIIDMKDYFILSLVECISTGKCCMLANKTAVLLRRTVGVPGCLYLYTPDLAYALSLQVFGSPTLAEYS